MVGSKAAAPTPKPTSQAHFLPQISTEPLAPRLPCRESVRLREVMDPRSTWRLALYWNEVTLAAFIAARTLAGMKGLLFRTVYLLKLGTWAPKESPKVRRPP